MLNEIKDWREEKGKINAIMSSLVDRQESFVGKMEKVADSLSELCQEMRDTQKNLYLGEKEFANVHQKIRDNDAFYQKRFAAYDEFVGDLGWAAKLSRAIMTNFISKLATATVILIFIGFMGTIQSALVIILRPVMKVFLGG
jgi:hypothetical protein